MARAALLVTVAMLALPAVAAAATGPPAFSLRDGQTMYLLPSQAQPGRLIRCSTSDRTIEARISALPFGVKATTGADSWQKGGPGMSIERRSDGATELRCGSATSGNGFFGRPTPTQYVIGKNGFGVPSGRDRLSQLARLYGRPSALSTMLGGCRATWGAIGLVATFSDRCNGALVSSTVHGSRWSSLSGVRVGETLAKLRWDVQDARAVAPGRWLVASGGVTGRAKLEAVVHAGRVVRLELTP